MKRRVSTIVGHHDISSMLHRYMYRKREVCVCVCVCVTHKKEECGGLHVPILAGKVEWSVPLCVLGVDLRPSLDQE